MDRAILFGNITDFVPELMIDNYKVWKKRVILQLEWMNIDYAIMKDEPPSITETSSPDDVDLYEKWERSNNLCVRFIMSKICASIRGSLDHHTKVRELLEAIDEQFVKSDKALASTLLREYSRMRHNGFNGFKSVGDYIMKMRDIVAKLNDLEVTISETFLVHSILCTLPHQYEPIKIYYTRHKDKLSINELMTMCVQEERRLMMKDGKHVNHNTTSSSKKKNGRMNEEGKVSANQGIKKEFACFFCKRKGHMKKECNKFKAWLQKKGYDKPKEVIE